MIFMQKVFYVSKNSENNDNHGNTAPDFDRFSRIEKLNLLLSMGWNIKSFSSENNEEYFVLEKEQ
jgi:hypothetical protein